MKKIAIYTVPAIVVIASFTFIFLSLEAQNESIDTPHNSSLESQDTGAEALSNNTLNSDTDKLLRSKTAEEKKSVDFRREIESQLLSMEQGEVRMNVVGRLLASWSEASIQEAVSWLLSETQNYPELEAYYQLVFGVYMEQDFEAAGAAILDLPTTDLQRQPLADYVDKFSLADPAAALEWMTNIFDDSLRDYSLGRVVEIWSSSKPEDVMHHLTVQADFPIEIRGYAASVAANRLAEKGKLNKENIYQYPDDVRPEIVGGLVDYWSKVEPQDALDWIRSLTEHRLRDQAIESYLGVMSAGIPENFQLATSAFDDGVRVRSVKEVFKNWYLVDQISAKQALDSNENLSDKQKNEMLALATEFL